DEARRLLAAERRALDGLARATRNLAVQARGRTPHADRDLRLPAHDVRHRAEPGSPLRLPTGRLRRLVGRGPGLALVQPLPPPPLRLRAPRSNEGGRTPPPPPPPPP